MITFFIFFKESEKKKYMIVLKSAATVFLHLSHLLIAHSLILYAGPETRPLGSKNGE